DPLAHLLIPGFRGRDIDERPALFRGQLLGELRLAGPCAADDQGDAGIAAQPGNGRGHGQACTGSRTFSRRVTNSSAAVGCMPTVASKSAFFAPALMAMAMPWMISPASGPTIWAPTTRSVRASTTSFIRMRSSLPDSVARIGRKMVR